MAAALIQWLHFVMAQIESSAGASEAIDLVLPDRRHRLPRVPTASGVRYTAGGISVWNKGREAVAAAKGSGRPSLRHSRSSAVRSPSSTRASAVAESTPIRSVNFARSSVVT